MQYSIIQFTLTHWTKVNPLEPVSETGPGTQINKKNCHQMYMCVCVCEALRRNLQRFLKHTFFIQDE